MKSASAQSYGPTVHGDEWQQNAFRIHRHFIYFYDTGIGNPKLTLRS